MRKYERVVGTFFRKIAKLEKIYDKNKAKIDKLLDKANRIEARIQVKIEKLKNKNNMLDKEAEACKKTAEKFSDFLS
jgi:FtsZ-binding cell division protein ZapB